MKRKIIIGIHGLGNKPPRKLLKKWWQLSICEGLERIGVSRPCFNFELVYWAHFMHSQPLNVKTRDKTDPLYLEHPYVPGKAQSLPFSPSRLKRTRLDITEKILDTLFLKDFRIINFDGLSDFIIRKKFKDLALYYDKTSQDRRKFGLYAKTRIRQELAKTLKKHKRKDILLIAHSMGSIIAYDVLTQDVPGIKVHTFMTLGSPLGLPAIMKRIFREQHKDFKEEKKVASPENIVSAWVNFSDLNDRVAMNYNLADDYRENAHGIAPQDFVVDNDYEFEGEKNHHKSYGYLRTPEVAKVIHQFLSEAKLTPLEAIRSNLTNFFRNWTDDTALKNT